MEQMKKFKLSLIISLLCLVTVFGLLFFATVNTNPDVIFASTDSIEEYYIPELESYDISNYQQEDLNEGIYSNLTFKQYVKGDKVVNIMFNFVNYANDTENHFTKSEISTTMITFTENIKAYFSRMSQGYVTINLDYVCSTATSTYDYYLSLSDANSNLENNIFMNAVNAGLDYDGNTKTFKFNEYNIKINAFAGNSGAWETFLWPHAFSSQSLIMLTEYKQSLPMSFSTVCHEMLHTFGVGDLYSYTGTQLFAVGAWDIMGSSQKHLQTNAYFRQKIGWINSSLYNDNQVTPIEEISAKQRGELSLKVYASCTSDYTKTIAYKFGENSKNNEFFMLEYRVQGYKSVYDSTIPKTCVTIYRVHPGANGNRNGNASGSFYNEIIFMGDSSYNVSTSTYINSCGIIEGETYGNKGDVTTTSLVYSSAGGKSNLFNGENSNIEVEVLETTNEYAEISISFATDSIKIDLADTTWNFDETTYNGESKSVYLLNIPSGLGITYGGDLLAINAGDYTATVTFTYDSVLYSLINDDVNRTLNWTILPSQITVQADNKSTKYGETLKPLTYSVTSGEIYNNDDLNIQLAKESGFNKGRYEISISAQNDNYDITLINGEYLITSRIVELDIYNQTLKSLISEEINQEKFEILTSYDSVVDGYDLGIILVLEKINEKSYIISATSNNENYELIINKGILSIVKTQIDLSKVKWNYNNNITYNGNQFSVALMNIPSGVNVLYGGQSFATNAGLYTATVTIKPENDSYEIINDNFAKTLQWEISKANIKIVAEDKTTKYGETLADLTYKITSGKVYNNDNLNVELIKQEGINKGEYVITCNANNSNYNIQTINGKYLITARTIAINVLDQELTSQNNNELDQTKYEILTNYDSILEGDNLNIEITGIETNFSKVGNYVLTANSENQNYELIINQGLLTITANGAVNNSNSTVNLLPIIIAILAVIALGTTVTFILIKKKKSNN